MDPQELEPLEAGILPPPTLWCDHRPSVGTNKRHRQSYGPRACFKGPLRLCRLIALVIVLPSLFVLVPLYLRYRVYSGQMYPMSMTDMRLIDSKISPTWCQRQVVHSNATFNAFVVPSQPQLTGELVPVSMTRELELEDDMKEYWGFYLLRGSSVTVSACVRWPGASLIMIKGYKHLQSCAYIGDDSSEELDELVQAYEAGLLNITLLEKKIGELKKVDGKANQPETMKRHKSGVQFHDPNVKGNASSPDSVPTVDVTDHDPKELRAILEHLHALRQAQKNELSKTYRPPDHLEVVAGLHRHRDTNVDKDERKWLSFKDIDGSEQSHNSRMISNKEIPKLQNPKSANNKKEISKANSELNTTELPNNEITKSKIHDDIPAAESISKNKTEASIENESKSNGELEKIEDEIQTKVTEANYVTINVAVATDADRQQVRKNILSKQNTTAEEQSSREVFEDVLQKLQNLGDRGKRVLLKLHETMGVEYDDKHTNEHIMSAVTGSDEELDRLRKVLVEAIDEEKTRPQRQQKRRDARAEARAKRELLLGQADFTRELNEDDEPRNFAAEEDPDGFAEHHETLNETTAFDMSNSEFWSSFSSSEEALLECEGLILNLPLTPHPACHSGASEDETMSASRPNALTYRVPANGYYFFVFNSENEVQKNYIRAKFDLQKTRYDVARTKLRECANSTSRCDLDLDIFSSQKVVLELPLRDNDSLWNEQFVIISECEPRTSIYLFCVIAVPILIIIFGFQ